jgi:REP element-mobilizing transposase RayT
MANTYHQIYLQTVFAVKYRNAVIDKKWRSQLLGVIGNLINEANCKTIIVNGVDDHVHCFLGLKPVVSVSELMKTVKAKSSKYINDHNLTPRKFEWQALPAEGQFRPVGRRAMVFFHTDKVMSTLSLNTFKIRKNIIKQEAFVMSILTC